MDKELHLANILAADRQATFREILFDFYISQSSPSLNVEWSTYVKDIGVFIPEGSLVEIKQLARKEHVRDINTEIHISNNAETVLRFVIRVRFQPESDDLSSGVNIEILYPNSIVFTDDLEVDDPDV